MYFVEYPSTGINQMFSLIRWGLWVWGGRSQRLSTVFIASYQGYIHYQHDLPPLLTVINWLRQYLSDSSTGKVLCFPPHAVLTRGSPWGTRSYGLAPWDKLFGNLLQEKSVYSPFIYLFLQSFLILVRIHTCSFYTLDYNWIYFVALIIPHFLDHSLVVRRLSNSV